jgi:AcrR family transcriptional regulator
MASPPRRAAHDAAGAREDRAGGRAPVKRGVGRPRADPRRLQRSPADEILFVAAGLFARHGFAATTTRAIAAAAGLRQPSLFHHFASKEAILEALLDRSLAATLAFAEREARAPGPAAVRLYRALRFDVHHLCAFPFDLTAVLSPEVRAPRYRRFWRERARLVAALRRLVRAGLRSGELVASDAATVADALFGMSEATLSWYRRGGKRTPEAVAQQVADLALRALLRDPATLDRVRAAAGPLHDDRDAGTAAARATGAAAPARATRGRVKSR